MSEFQQRGNQIRQAHKNGPHAALADDRGPHRSWPSDSALNPALALATEIRRQEALQYMTLSQSVALHLRHTIVPPQTAQTFCVVVGLLS